MPTVQASQGRNRIAPPDSHGKVLDEAHVAPFFSPVWYHNFLPNPFTEANDWGPKTSEDSIAIRTNSCVWNRSVWEYFSSLRDSAFTATAPAAWTARLLYVRWSEGALFSFLFIIGTHTSCTFWPLRAFFSNSSNIYQIMACPLNNHWGQLYPANVVLLHHCVDIIGVLRRTKGKCIYE